MSRVAETGEGHPATSSDYGDLERAAALLRVPVRMRQSRIIVVGDAKGTSPACSGEQVKRLLGP
jgi:hypothetical protein